MTRNNLLECFRALTVEETQDIIMPTRTQKDDIENKDRAAKVYMMRLPDKLSSKTKAPYIIHQLITGKDIQSSGSEVTSSAVIRSIFCVYNDNEEDGALMLVNLMERLRIRLLKQMTLGDRYQLDISSGLESIIYADNIAPYYAGEMVSVWKLPAISREIIL